MSKAERQIEMVGSNVSTELALQPANQHNCSSCSFAKLEDGSLIETWKELSSAGGYYLNKIKYVQVDHDVKFVKTIHDPKPKNKAEPIVIDIADADEMLVEDNDKALVEINSTCFDVEPNLISGIQSEGISNKTSNSSQCNVNSVVDQNCGLQVGALNMEIELNNIPSAVIDNQFSSYKEQNDAESGDKRLNTKQSEISHDMVQVRIDKPRDSDSQLKVTCSQLSTNPVQTHFNNNQCSINDSQVNITCDLIMPGSTQIVAEQSKKSDNIVEKQVDVEKGLIGQAKLCETAPSTSAHQANGEVSFSELKENSTQSKWCDPESRKKHVTFDDSQIKVNSTGFTNNHQEKAKANQSKDLINKANIETAKTIETKIFDMQSFNSNQPSTSTPMRVRACNYSTKLSQFRRFRTRNQASPTAINLINHLREMQANLSPNQVFFDDLTTLDEWVSDAIITEPDKLTSLDIKRIKKGMMNGKLYNISQACLRKIFPFSPPELKKSNTTVSKNDRCPLCENYQIIWGQQDFYNHVEKMHTCTPFSCIRCGEWYGFGKSAKAHVANCPKAVSSDSSNDEDEREALSDRSDCEESVNSSSDTMDCEDGDTKRIENGYFSRSAIERQEIVYYSRRVNAVIETRKTLRGKLRPFWNLFSNLHDIQEWDEFRLVPLPEDLTESQIKQIKKGMVNGKLYNISSQTLALVYPNLLNAVKEIDGAIRTTIRCPLCPKYLISSKNIYHHIEQLHTASLVVCMKCRFALTNQPSVERHINKGCERKFKKEVPSSYSECSTDAIDDNI